MVTGVRARLKETLTTLNCQRVLHDLCACLPVCLIINKKSMNSTNNKNIVTRHFNNFQVSFLFQRINPDP